MHAQAQWANGIYIPGPGAPMPSYWSGTNCRASGWAQVGGPIYSAELFLNGELVNEWANGIYIPGPGAPMPSYWSGTNCRASGWAQVGGPIYSAELFLNGELVNEWVCGDPVEEEPPWTLLLEAMFDSSHFANGTPVEVTFRVLTYMGWQEGSSDPDPVVQNKLMMFEDPAPPTPDPVPTVQALMTGKNYALIAEDGSSWTKTDYFAAMNGSNAVMFAGHGNPSVHSVPVGSGIHWAEYEAYRISHIGSGIPPFNAGAIPVNFCHIIACNCGDTNNFIRACYPYYMAWGGPWMENQALMAYKVYIPEKQLSEHAALIWNKLAEGQTARHTRDWFDEIWLEENPGEFRVWDEHPGPLRDMAPGDLALYCNYGGDQGAMRLKSVYTGTQVAPIGWYRPL